MSQVSSSSRLLSAWVAAVSHRSGPGASGFLISQARRFGTSHQRLDFLSHVYPVKSGTRYIVEVDAKRIVEPILIWAGFQLEIQFYRQSMFHIKQMKVTVDTSCQSSECADVQDFATCPGTDEQVFSEEMKYCCSTTLISISDQSVDQHHCGEQQYFLNRLSALLFYVCRNSGWAVTNIDLRNETDPDIYYFLTPKWNLRYVVRNVLLKCFSSTPRYAVLNCRYRVEHPMSTVRIKAVARWLLLDCGDYISTDLFNEGIL